MSLAASSFAAASYAAALDHLNSLGLELAPIQAAAHDTPTPDTAPARRKFDLAHMRRLAAALGNPQLNFPAVLIAGTNGKGSTAATLASILATAGYRTALYTSPHMVRVNERIQTSRPLHPSEYSSADVPASAGPGALHTIADEDFGRLYFKVDAAARALVEAGELPHPPSFFEVLTALAFCFFAEQKVDIAVLEVGLGGRLDATNIVEPMLSIITDIAVDHTEYLGTTIAEITREKAGILRQNGTLITLPQHPEANQAIGEAAAALTLQAISAAEYMPPYSAIPGGSQPVGPAFSKSSSGEGEGEDERSHLPANRYQLIVDGEPLQIDSPLPGQHQQRNLALAIAAAVTLRNRPGSMKGVISNRECYKISNSAIERGIRDTQWPGRLEFLSGTPEILLDVAHNPAGAWTLRAAIAQLPESQPRTLIFSCLRDKSITEMSRILLPLFDSSADGSPSRPQDHIIFAPINSPRATSVEELLRAAHALGIPAHAAPHVAGALAQARQVTPPDGLIVVTGSIYLVGELRQLVFQT